ncbi:hypothetical protein M9H77_06844 [Catharanthus roseus]|uniref:Uncharacterized protein n=1 Tax=Catharanthus roseus TaxID=4058 RepID=A0ACC0BTF7_CATRO|nr:hypothetical protein M9H77_06844 [Catharanthus roseus]
MKFEHCPLLLDKKNFYIYKLDTNFEIWVPMERLGNVALFVGENESVSFNTAEDGVGERGGLTKNSILFSDDFWKNGLVNMIATAMELSTTLEFSIWKMESTICGEMDRNLLRSGNIFFSTHYNSLPEKKKKKNFMCLDSNSKRWVPIERVGNVPILLGRNESLSFSTSENDAGEGGGLKKNSIYFTDDFWEKNPVNMKSVNVLELITRYGIFNLEDGSIEEISLYATHRDLSLSFLLPSF